MAETGSWSDYIVTEAGRNLQQRCIAESKKPVFTKAVIGTGKPSDPSIIESMTSIIAFAKNVVIKKSYSIEANHLSIVRVDNEGYTADVLMTEVGIFAKSEEQNDSEAILYGYAYNVSGYILIPAQTSATNRKIFEITIDTNLSRSVEISIIFDGSSLWVSHADMDDLEASMNAQLSNKANLNLEVHELPITAVCKLNGGMVNTYRKNSFGEMVVAASLLPIGQYFPIRTALTLVILPAGFRPLVKVARCAATFWGDSGPQVGHIDIQPDGALRTNVNDYADIVKIEFIGSFYVPNT